MELNGVEKNSWTSTRFGLLDESLVLIIPRRGHGQLSDPVRPLWSPDFKCSVCAFGALLCKFSTDKTLVVTKNRQALGGPTLVLTFWWWNLCQSGPSGPWWTYGPLKDNQGFRHPILHLPPYLFLFKISLKKSLRIQFLYIRRYRQVCLFTSAVLCHKVFSLSTATSSEAWPRHPDTDEHYLLGRGL